MVEKISFENSMNKDLMVSIEPAAEYIDWGIGKIVEIELKLTRNEYNETFSFVLNSDGLLIHELGQYEMKIFIDKELKFYT